jgi:hypothetical protein
VKPRLLHALYVALCLIVLLPPAAHARTISLLTYSGEGAVTTPVIVNPTDHDVKYPDSTVCSPTGCEIVKGLVIPSGTVVRLSPIAPARGIVGAYQLELQDPGLAAYSEIVTGAKALFRVGELAARESVRYFDLAAPGRYNGWLILIAADGPAVIVRDGQRFELNKNGGVLLPGPADGHIEFVAQLPARFFVVAGINNFDTGSLQLVEPR